MATRRATSSSGTPWATNPPRPTRPEHASTQAWLSGELADLERAATDLLGAPDGGAVPTSVRLLLDAVGDGVKLNPGGRLPRHVLRIRQEQRPEWSMTACPAHLEEDLVPLAALHDTLREVGLLRPRHGIPHATRPAGAGNPARVRARCCRARWRWATSGLLAPGAAAAQPHYAG